MTLFEFQTPHYAISESEKLELVRSLNQENSIDDSLFQQSEKLVKSPANQETSLTESFLEQAFNTHMSQFEETTKSEFKVPISEPKSKINFTDLISKTKINSPSTPSPMKSQRLMQRRKQVSYLVNNLRWIKSIKAKFDRLQPKKKTRYLGRSVARICSNLG